MTRLIMALGVAGLAAFGYAFGFGGKPEPKVICCGECKPGDNCLEKCRVVGEVPKDLTLTCCGKCLKGDDCMKKCAGSGSCCGK
jgi:hypothetical protein